MMGRNANHAAGKKQIAALRKELEVSQGAYEKVQEQLTGEKRRQRVLQLALKKGLQGSRTTTPHSHRSFLPDTEGRVRRPHTSVVGANREVVEIWRQNEVMLLDLASAKGEIERLKRENAHLLKVAKDAQQDMGLLRAQISTNVHDRAVLARKLEKKRDELKRHEKSATRMVGRWIQRKHKAKAAAEEARWAQIEMISQVQARRRDHMPSRPKQHRNIMVSTWGNSSAKW